MISLICLLFTVSYALLYVWFKERICGFALRECELYMTNYRLQEELSLTSRRLSDANNWHHVCATNLMQSRDDNDALKAENDTLIARITAYNNVVDELNKKLEVNGYLLDSYRIMIGDLHKELDACKTRLSLYEPCA
jgi:hypothetical protein